jgi:hypothetical protein
MTGRMASAVVRSERSEYPNGSVIQSALLVLKENDPLSVECTSVFVVLFSV